MRELNHWTVLNNAQMRAARNRLHRSQISGERNENAYLPVNAQVPRFGVRWDFPVVLEFIMAPRAYWKGYLKLSLVSCPIALFPATSAREKISFHQLNKKSGHRIEYRKVDAETVRSAY